MKTLILVLLLLGIAVAVDATNCTDCPYDQPCVETSLKDCLLTSYDVFCIEDSEGREHWLFGNTRGGMIEGCTSSIENPYAELK